ncbi:hypothetical protein Air01nite_77080 [Asanoa iriomotensis]|uniref:Uncharacterized protein n=1 Tax=Asanoa iriomotensis TaxID=234613 RepID=A0ABQ4CFR7_9ACTN|nr:hypothetical protein Air01nite_77080 [Asanoa iriomotensis]
MGHDQRGGDGTRGSATQPPNPVPRGQGRNERGAMPMSATEVAPASGGYGPGARFGAGESPELGHGGGARPVRGGQPVAGRTGDALSGQAGPDGALAGGTAEVPAVPVPQPPHLPGAGRTRDDDGGIA